MRESKLWVLSITSAGVIFVLLGLHMVIMHLDAILGSLGLSSGDPVSVSSVFARSKQVFFMITYIVLLGAALYHGFYGLRNIILELCLAQAAEKAVSVILTLAGIVLFVYGAFAAVYIFII